MTEVQSDFPNSERARVLQLKTTKRGDRYDSNLENHEQPKESWKASAVQILSLHNMWVKLVGTRLRTKQEAADQQKSLGNIMNKKFIEVHESPGEQIYYGLSIRFRGLEIRRILQGGDKYLPRFVLALLFHTGSLLEAVGDNYGADRPLVWTTKATFTFYSL